MIPILLLTVFCIRRNNERGVVEHLLDFRLRNAMLFVLARVSFVPIKAGNPRPIHLYIIYIYKISNTQKVFR